MSSNRSEVFAGVPLIISFNQILTTDETNEILFRSVRYLLDDLSEAGWQAAGLDILACITSNDVPRLCNLDLDILDLGSKDQSILRQCSAFFGKRQDIDLGVDREDSAYRKFREAELACSLTNACFRAWKQGRFQFTPFVERILHASAEKIRDLLGEVPSLSEIRPRFGPGATTVTPKKNSCPVVKLKSKTTCSANFAHLLPDVVNDIVLDGSENADFVEVEIHPNKLAFVPKTAKIDRAICTEPVLNGMYQNGLGELMAARLRRVGIDIRDQTPNQRAALYGSISGVSATLDLSSASDTVSLLLVEHLLPSSWYDLICGLRSAIGTYRNHTVIHYEKVSSMGNGFTFPLETIIFWALAQSVKEAVSPRSRIRTLVYGDDIITPTECAAPLMQVLRSLGFTPNDQKSFYKGNFRESCGKDYVYGIDVRPVYQAGPLTGADFFRLHNFFLAHGNILQAEYWKSMIDQSIRRTGPSGFGDGHLHSLQWSGKKSRDGGSFFETWGFRPNYLSKNLVRRLSSKVKYYPPRWDSTNLEWIAQNSRASTGRVYHSDHFRLVMRLATYTQYLRDVPRTLTMSDAERSKGSHVYADRRMPNPQTSDDERFFVIPGTGPLHLTKVYTFESPICP